MVRTHHLATWRLPVVWACAVCVTVAWASPPVEGLTLQAPEWPVGPSLYEDLLEQAEGHRAAAGPEGHVLPVWIEAPDGDKHLLKTLRPPDPPPVPVKDPEPLLGSTPVVHPSRGAGDLAGKAIYMSQCHGWYYNTSLATFLTQRPNLFDTAEDFHNPEGANVWLMPYLENAGAQVYTTRERDMQSQMAIVDNGDPGYSETGTGFSNGLAGFANTAPYAFAEDPFNQGTTRTFPSNGGGVATWTPVAPAAGSYAVYVSWDAASGHSSAAHYRITHPGGVIDRFFDQRVHGSTWQYVETVWLDAGAGQLTVELIADDPASGALLSADAVRIGGGTDDVQRGGQLTGLPRWESAALQYVPFLGAPPSVYDPYGDGNGIDHQSRARWAAWEHPSGEDALYLAWHSNAATGSARGTSTYYAGGGTDAPSSHSNECSGPAVTGSYTYAQTLQDEMVDAARALWEPTWPQSGNGVNRACFSEVSSTLNPEMPSALVELAFHDNATDAGYLKNPAFRRDMSRAMYRATVRYFADRDGLTPHFLPEPPVDLSLVHNSAGVLELSWSAGPSGAPYGDPATDYTIQTSADGKVWSDAFTVSHSGGGTQSTPLGALIGQTRFVRVVAENQGGLSFASEVVGARRDPAGQPGVLVVSGFDRLDTGLLPRRSPRSFGEVVTLDLPRTNPFDTAVAHGLALADAGWTFDTVSDEAFLTTDLSGYDLVVWVAGEESSGTVTISAAQQALLQSFWSSGGGLMVSGAEVLWDLDNLGDATDQAFASSVLGAGMAADDAGTEAVDGEGLWAGLTLDFGEVDGAPYPVEYPDVLSTSRTVVARYVTGGINVAAALGDQVLMMGFPFETVGDPTVRAELMARSVPELAPSLVQPNFGQPTVDTGLTKPPGPGDTDAPADTDTPPVDTPTDTDVTGDSAVPDSDTVVQGPDARADGVPLAALDRGGCGGCQVPGGSPTGAVGTGLAMLLGMVRRRRRLTTAPTSLEA